MRKMAFSLARLSWTFLAKRHAQNSSRCAVVAFAERYTRIRSFHSQQRKRETQEKRASSLLTYTALAASGLCYAAYKWRDDIREGIKRLDNVCNYPTVHASTLPPAGRNRDKYNFIADVVEACAPSVVYIDVVDNKRQRKDLFATPSYSVGGSGVIVSQDGLILTNAHVVLCKPNTTINVKLYDGSVHNGVIEDIDMHNDFVTIRINKTNLPVMKLGTSSDLRAGEFVIAMGSPLNFRNTVTSGVVSSVNREIPEIGHHTPMGYIQTDAAITFGNSGGPLVNLDGEAIGINSLKVATGISFAIPIDHAKEFLKKAEARRKQDKKVEQNGFRKRYLGMTMQSLIPNILIEIQQDNKYKFITHGVLVWKVIPGSPVDNAGIRPKDIITFANQEPVISSDDIYKILEKPGTIRFSVIREGTLLYVNVDPEEV